MGFESCLSSSNFAPPVRGDSFRPPMRLISAATQIQSGAYSYRPLWNTIVSFKVPDSVVEVVTQAACKLYIWLQALQKGRGPRRVICLHKDTSRLKLPLPVRKNTSRWLPCNMAGFSTSPPLRPRLQLHPRLPRLLHTLRQPRQRQLTSRERRHRQPSADAQLQQEAAKRESSSSAFYHWGR